MQISSSSSSSQQQQLEATVNGETFSSNACLRRALELVPGSEPTPEVWKNIATLLSQQQQEQQKEQQLIWKGFAYSKEVCIELSENRLELTPCEPCRPKMMEVQF